MSGTLLINHSFCSIYSKILSTKSVVIGSTATYLNAVCCVLSNALPSIEWLSMSLETLLVNIFCSYFLLYPYIKPGIAFFRLFQNKVYSSVRSPQYSELGLQIVRGLSETPTTEWCTNLFNSALYTSPPLRIVLKLPLLTRECWHSFISYFM